ncbi:HAMP domain-containing protein [Actinobacteria bacterium YIM 96077]|uniref:histidine kinase n=1 Tax=Phytoactinopolyspora halophila TaxID=1981511 RepID=A0A329QGN0_9ACTN|nr:nitrate- and nitrite sensing domain-containing protein [Phytoactinopolyspora halophila]AYY14686.1 HAMP domain-containing protein [Actinobacteria bacterium YIM 96077]RAW11603.1 hypothetical protein DPM12_16135 [Phytoactinopolyspora halophila]
MSEGQDEAYDQNEDTTGDGDLNGEVSRPDGTGARSGRHASRRAVPSRTKSSGFLRPRSVRAKIVAVLMVPVISLMALWGFATVTTAQSVSELQQLKEVNATLLSPINEFVAAVQEERTAAAEYMADPEIGTDALVEAGQQTDAAAAALRDGISQSSTDAAGLDPRLPERIETLVESADFVSTIRERVNEQSVSWIAAFDAYSATINNAFQVTGVLTQLDAPGVDFDPRIVMELSLAREMISQGDAAIRAAEAGDVMTHSQFTTLEEAANAGQALLWTDIDDPRPSAEDAYRDILEGESYQTLRDLEENFVAQSAGYLIVSDIAESDWSGVADSTLQQLANAEARVSTIAAEEADLFSFDVLGTSGIAVALGLAGVVLSLLISVFIGRGLVVELAGLHNTAMDLATRKLPATLRRLNAGQKVDVETEAPRVAHGDDEVSQVAEALNTVHRSAVEAAIERSDVLKGISGVYVYLARRSQVLLHRQLSLLDNMERRTEDPDQLEDLFRLDHLTTRMRRQAESLIILSGVTPARRWRNPVPMMDVVRGAVAEVEDFTRVEVARIPDVRIAGSAIADLTHLIAELVENAVVFSPPNTKATVRGELVGNGLALEIEDRGLGMSRQAMEDANRRIKETDQVDLLEADQLGLFVVNRLSRRHNIEVTLQRSAYGGVIAIVLIPDELLEKSEHPEDLEATSPGHAPAVEQQQQPQLAAVGSASSMPGPRSAFSDGEQGGGEHEPAQQMPRRQARGEQGPQQAPPPSHHANSAAENGAADQSQEGDVDELPRRVRQASLRPELRNQNEPPPPPREAPNTNDHAARSPEQARATLSAMRTGWLQGQSEKHDESPQGGHNQ